MISTFLLSVQEYNFWYLDYNKIFFFKFSFFVMFFKYVFYFQLLLSYSRIFFTCQRSNIIFKLSFSFRVVGVLAAFAFSENTWSLLALLCTDFLPPKSLRHVALNSIKNTFYVQCRSLWLCTMTKYILTLDVMLTGAALNKKTPVYFFFRHAW